MTAGRRRGLPPAIEEVMGSVEADPCGMTTRKATARAKAKEEADPCGMTTRKATAKARATAKYRGLSATPRKKPRGSGRDDDWLGRCKKERGSGRDDGWLGSEVIGEGLTGGRWFVTE
jgi:hypothetical protein